MRHFLSFSNLLAVFAPVGMALTIAPASARADTYAPATIAALPHLDRDGFQVWPADGNSLVSVYRLGGKELRLQVHEAFVPAAGSMPGADGTAAASIGGCVVDESGLLLSGWGIDGDGEEFAELPQVLGDAAAANDAAKLNALQTWCEERAELWQGFVSLSRELEIEDFANQSTVLGPRYAAWTLMLAQARNLGALCLFAKHYTGHAATVQDYFLRRMPDAAR